MEMKMEHQGEWDVTLKDAKIVNVKVCFSFYFFVLSIANGIHIHRISRRKISSYISAIIRFRNKFVVDKFNI